MRSVAIISVELGFCSPVAGCSHLKSMHRAMGSEHRNCSSRCITRSITERTRQCAAGGES